MINVEHLSVCYGSFRAVDDVTISIKKGEVFGIVGRNGAGKTTLVETIEGLRRKSAGVVNVCGIDPSDASRKKELYSLMSVQLQSTSYPERARVGELCKMFSSIYKNAGCYKLLLERFSLLDKCRAYISDLSGGQRQKLSILLAMLSNPKIIFFDEITTGLDAHARRDIWECIKGLRDSGITVVLVTHFMDDVEVLCDRIGVMQHGRLTNVGTQEELTRLAGLSRNVAFKAAAGLAPALEQLTGVTKVVCDGESYQVMGPDDELSGRILAYLERGGVAYREFATCRPMMEDVFLRITKDDCAGKESK